MTSAVSRAITTSRCHFDVSNFSTDLDDVNKKIFPILHKRSYCEKRHCDVTHQAKSGDDDPYKEPEDIVQHSLNKVQHPCMKPAQTTVFVVPENPIETVFEEDTWDINDYAPSLALLQEAGVLEEIEGSPVLDAISSHKKRKGHQINSIAAKLKSKVDDAFDDSYYQSKLIRLEKMCQTKNAVFQTLSTDDNTPTMGQQYAELQKAQKLGTHLLGPDGKILLPSCYDPLKMNEFGTRYKPTLHDSRENDVSDKNMGSKTRESPNSSTTATETQYICPRCSKEFSSVSNTYRHLVNVHGFTKVGAVRLKNKIVHRRLIKTKKCSIPPKPSTTKTDECLVVRSRSSSEVSSAHFSKLDQMRAEECLTNLPKIKIPEKLLKFRV
jgi:uncharacterized C2H2 Zn-finger protein